MKSYLDEQPFVAIAGSEISNPQAPPSDKLSAGASRIGSAYLGAGLPHPDELMPESKQWAELGNTGIDAAIRGIEFAGKPLHLPKGEDL